MNPIQELKDEHRAIESALHILEKVAQAIESTAGQADAAAMLDFLAVFADTCHHGKEERALFPALESMGVSKQGGPLGVMLYEHDQGRTHLRGMRGALQALEQGESTAADDFRGHAREYADLLRRHIEKEDHVLFDIAERQLPAELKRKIQVNFDRIEHDVVGAGRHEAFHRLLDEMMRKYERPA